MSWDALTAELELWRAAGRTATFWWRDDDAVADTEALRRLLALRAALDVPLALAVIPERADDSLAALVPAEVAVLQHGWAHRNHAPAGMRKMELGHRPVAEVATELQHGWTKLARLFGDRPLRVMVPPWNRIAPEVRDALPGLGYVGLSTFKPRGTAPLAEVNTHLDIVYWDTPRYFIGEASALETVVEHLMLRRTRVADPEEPTGLLTHHLAHDEGCWRFVEDFVQCMRAHPAVRWLKASDAFGP